MFPESLILEELSERVVAASLLRRKTEGLTYNTGTLFFLHYFNRIVIGSIFKLSACFFSYASHNNPLIIFTMNISQRREMTSKT